MVVRYHVSVAVFRLVDLQVGMLPCELLTRVDGLGSRGRDEPIKVCLLLRLVEGEGYVTQK